MAWQHRRRQWGAFFLVAGLCILCAVSVTNGAPGGAAGEEDTQNCEENRDIHLEISGQSPAVQFKCGTDLTHLLPAITDGSKGIACFTEATCTKPAGSLPSGAEITVDNQNKVYTVRTTEIPTADATAYFLCTDTNQQPSAKQAVKKCTVEVKIRGSAPISKLQSAT